MQHNIAAGNRAQLAQLQQRNNSNPYGVASSPFSHQRNLSGANQMVHQGAGMGGIGNAYVGSAIYNAQTNTHNVQPVIASTPICNLSDTAQILSSVPTPSNITFRNLPFYKLKHEVLRPAILNANSLSSLPANVRTSATQEFHLTFVLSCAMASDLAMNRDTMKNEYVVQAQLRITAVESANQTNSTEYDDFLPLGLVVRVNGRQCNTLPPCSPSTRQGAESRRIPRPISLTHLIKMSPMNANQLIINWAPETGKMYVVTLNLVEKLSSQFLLDRLNERPKISVDSTKLMIREQYKRVIDDDDEGGGGDDADDDDIATTIVRVSLVCPLVKFRMTYPAKGKNCSHLQCFDGNAYISLNEKKPTWNCPVCNRALYYDDLLLDQYFLDVLQNDQLSPDCQEVQLLVDGTWKSYDEDTANESNNDRQNANAQSANKSPNSSPLQQNAVCSGDSISEDNDRKHSTPVDNSSDTANANAGPIVDLISDDEEALEEPSSCEPPTVPPVPAVPEESKGASVGPVDTPSSVAPVTESTNDTENGPLASNTDDTVADKDPTPPLTNAVTTDTTSSTMVSSSGYTSPPNIISLDSPSPPSFSSSPAPTTLAALNIGN